MANLSVSSILKKGILIISVFIFLIVVLMSKSLVEFVDNTEYAIHQNAANGKLTVWNTPGLHWQLFGKVVKFKKAGDIYLSSDELDGGSGKDVQPVSILFPDGNAKADVVCRYELSLSDSVQINIYKKFGNKQALHNMIRQQIIEAVKGVGPLMSSSEAYSSRRPEVAVLARDMALTGIYASQVIIDTSYTIENGDSTLIKIKHYNVKKENNRPVITKTSILKDYNIILPIFTVKDMHFDSKTVKLIEARKDAQLAKQDAITAFQNGQARIAKERATQEVEKIKQVTIAEKEAEVARIDAERQKSVAVTKAEKEKMVAKLQKERERELKEATILKAQAKKQELQIADGLSERAKYTIDKQTEAKVKVAQALAKWVGPRIVMSGDSKGSAGGVENALMIKMMSDMVDKAAK